MNVRRRSLIRLLGWPLSWVFSRRSNFGRDFS